jgi:hypothetical protein
MRDQFNCPNCGAPIASDICPYCGTAFLDWSCIDERKENWIKIKFNGQIRLVKARMTYLGFEYDAPETTLLCDDQKYFSIQSPEFKIHMDMLAEKFTIPGYGKTSMLQIDPEVADLRQVSDILKGAKQNE